MSFLCAVISYSFKYSDYRIYFPQYNIRSLAQDSVNTIANGANLQQSCPKPWMYTRATVTCSNIGWLVRQPPTADHTHFAMYTIASTAVTHEECEPVSYNEDCRCDRIGFSAYLGVWLACKKIIKSNINRRYQPSKKVINSNDTDIFLLGINVIITLSTEIAMYVPYANNISMCVFVMKTFKPFVIQNLIKAVLGDHGPWILSCSVQSVRHKSVPSVWLSIY